MVTTPVLFVSPAGMERVVFPVSVVVSVGFTDTVTVVAALDADGTLAVTVLAFPVPLSLIVAGVSSRVTFPAGAASSSVMLTVVWVVVPVCTVAGSVPKVSRTLSPSSSTVSCVAVKVNAFEVSPALNITFAGTPE